MAGEGRAANSIVTESVLAFLRPIPPFQFLNENELRALAAGLTLEYFPRGSVILRAGRAAAAALYVVQKGAVRLSLRSGVGKEMVFDMRGEGDLFGVLSLLGRESPRLDVTAEEDTLCYAVPAQAMERLIESHPDVADFFYRTSLKRYLERSLNQLRERGAPRAESERLLYSLSAGDAVQQVALTCAPGTTIAEAARLAAAARSSCLFVTADNGRTEGVVTDRDFAAKVVAGGLSPQLPVTQIMSAPVIAVDSEQRLFEVLLEMLEHNIHHVLVIRGGRPDGVLTHHDLLLLQGKSPLNLLRHLDRLQTLDELASAQKPLLELLPLLLREGARASHITRVVAQLNDHLMRRILSLLEARLGPPPVAYCWVVLGSEGRREQTFRTDQDNGLIFTPPREAQRATTLEYFRTLAEGASQALLACGYPLCPGGYMASNPFWRQSVEGWREYFRQWITGATVRSVEDALIFFDMRPVAGDVRLFEELSEEVRRRLVDSGFFLSILGHVSLRLKPPLGFFRTFVLERSGDHQRQLDLKLSGTAPIVNAARLFALAAGCMTTNTSERLQTLRTNGGPDSALFQDLLEAFEFLSMLRLECQLRQVEQRQPPDNYIDPASLSHLQRSLLREAFQAVERAQSLIESRFRSAIWMQLGH